MADLSGNVKSELSPAQRSRNNLQVALRAIKAGVPVLALGTKKRPAVQAFNTLDTDISDTDRERLRREFFDKHEFEPLGIGSTLNESYVRAWGKRPNFAVGISPGLVGAVVVDCDDDGGARFLAFLAESGEAVDYTRTPVTVTSRGRHFWFKNPGDVGCANLKAEIAADIKGIGGQVVAPGCIIEPKVDADGTVTPGDRHYLPLEGTPDLFATIKAGALPPYPACIAKLRPTTSKAKDSDAEINAVMELLARGPADDREPRDVLVMVAKAKAIDAAFAALWDAPSADTSDNRFKAARALLSVHGPARLDVFAYAELLSEWDGAGAYQASKQGRGSYDNRDIAREWTKSRNVERSGLHVEFPALRTPQEILDAVRGAALLELPMCDDANDLPEALSMADAPAEVVEAAERQVEALRNGQAGALEQLAAIVRKHGGAVEDEGPAVAKPPRFRFETSAELEAEEDDDSDFVVEDLIEAGTLFCFYGTPGAGKSALMLDMLLRIAHGLPWAGRSTTRTGVLYVCPEGPKGFARRHRAWLKVMREQGQDVGGSPFEVLRQQVDLFNDDVAIKAIAEQVRTFKRRHGIACGVVVVDTLRQALVGGDENSARDIGTFTARLTRLRDAYGVVCGFVHHDGKVTSRGAAGSTAIVGNVDVELVAQKPKTSHKGTIRAGKMRDGFLDGELPYELTTVVSGVRKKGKHKGEAMTAVVAVVGERDVSSSLPAVDLTEDVADLGAVEAETIDRDSDDARDAMMMQAARSFGQAFSRRDLYAAVRNLRTEAKLDRPDISDTRLDAVCMRLQQRGGIAREGVGKSSRWVVGGLRMT